MDAELLYSYLGIAKSIVYIWNFPIPNGRGDHSNEPRENGPSKSQFFIKLFHQTFLHEV